MDIPRDSDYHDRKTGLVVFGIIEVVIGILFVLMMLLMLLGQAMASRTASRPASPSMAVAMTLYAVIAAALIWLGVGSILARRWARAILLCFSAVTLVTGIIACASMPFVLSHSFDAIQQSGRPLPPAALLIAKVVSFLVVFVFYLVIPGVLFLFYRSPHVRRTCEVRDPLERWTDRCPLPVLAFSLAMFVGGLAFLGVLTRYHALPVFGVFVGGTTGLLLCVATGVLLLYLAWGTYRLRTHAWWLALGLLLLGAVNGCVMAWGGDFFQMYLKLGFDFRSAAASAQLLSLPVFKWLMAASSVLWLAWLLSLRRYFRKGEIPPVLPGAQAQTIQP